MNFPLTREEWYELRDDRTNRLISKRLGDDFSVGVYVSPEISESYALQCMTLLFCNNLARWCRKIIISIPDFTESLLPNVSENFRKYLKSTMHKIDPYGQFDFRDFGNQEVTLSLCIGEPKPSFGSCYWINGSGWIAGCGYGKPVKVKHVFDKNPIGPSFAAWFGSALLFNRATILTENREFSKYYSLFDYNYNERYSDLSNPSIPDSMNIGNICQIGCGAVGSSFDYLLSLTDFEGKLLLIDYDTIEYENCNNTPAFTPYDKNHDKVKICKNWLNQEKINTSSYTKPFNDFSKHSNFSNYDPDLYLCFANEENIWISLQNIIPSVVLSASTTPNWTSTFGRHIPFKEWCVVCAYYHLVNDTFTGKCSTGEIKTAEDVIVGNLPFLAPCSATFVLAELIRLNISQISQQNNISFSLKFPFNLNLNSNNPKKDCMCNTQDVDIYKHLRKNTKFFSLT